MTTPRLVCRAFVLALGLMLAGSASHAAFREDFDQPLTLDPSGLQGWTFHTGDGTAVMSFTGGFGHGTIQVDATSDRRGIWWAFIRRDVTAGLDLLRLAAPGSELRVEARVRSSHAPRRINLHLNTQRTTDFHGNLMEFDLPRAEEWQTISMTTHDFDGRPGDHVAVQLALMDWGLGRYRVDVDYIKVDVVDAATAGPDLGSGVPYRPPLANPADFRQSVAAAAAATIDRREPDTNLADWSAIGSGQPTPVLTVNGTQQVILRWDLRAFAGRNVQGSGLLELKSHSVLRPARRTQDFGMIHVVEILGGAADWTPVAVTYDQLRQGQTDEDVFNTQMIIDVEVNDTPGGSTLITLSNPVLQRLIDGRTKGITLRALGSINASFLPGKPDAADAPRLRFNLAD